MYLDSTKIFTGVNKKYFALKKKIFHLKVDVGVCGSPPRRVRARGSRATEDPSETVAEGGAELLELDGVDEGVDGGVGVAQPEHEAGPAVGEGDLASRAGVKIEYWRDRHQHHPGS